MAARFQRTAIGAAAIAALALGPAACAGVRVYSDPAMTHETGIKVFTPKPYLLVSRTGAKEQPVELSIVYLPDTRAPLYIRQQRGWGSSDLGVTLANGMLADFGAKSDSRTPEAFSSMGTLLTAAAGAYKTSREQLTALGAAAHDDLDEASQIVALIAQEMVKSTSGSSPATAPQAADAREIAATLNDVSAALADPMQANDIELALAKLSGVVTAIDALKMDSPPTGNNRVTMYNSRIDTLKHELQRVVEKIDAPQPAAFELYEIRQENGRTSLVRVVASLSPSR